MKTKLEQLKAKADTTYDAWKDAAEVIDDAYDAADALDAARAAEAAAWAVYRKAAGAYLAEKAKGETK